MYPRIPLKLVTDPLGTGHGSLGIRSAHFGNHCLTRMQLTCTVWVQRVNTRDKREGGGGIEILSKTIVCVTY